MALTKGIFGEEGKVTFKNTRTNLTFDSANVTNADDTIEFAVKPMYVVGDVVNLTVDPASGSALPAPLTDSTDYYVIIDTTDTTGKTIKLATSEADALAGTAVTLTDDGTGTAHSIFLKDFSAMANAISWTISPTKSVADATTLEQSIRSYRGGLVDASGTMTVLFEAGTTVSDTKARKIFETLFLPYDNGDMELELYLSTTLTGGTDIKVTCTAMVESGQLGATIGQLIQATINFRVNGSLDFSGAIDF